MSDETRVAAIVVNYRSAGLTLACLDALEHERHHGHQLRVVVVENASGDADALREGITARGFEAWVDLVVSDHNGGFSYGNNLGVRYCMSRTPRPNFYWLLNPDTEVRPGAMAALVDFMDTNPRAGITGSRFEEANGELWPYAFRFPSIWSELEEGLRLGPVSRLLHRQKVLQAMGDEPERVDWLPGASMMIRAEVFDTVGFMDEGYFLYYEETDFCRDAHKHGWETWYIPASRVMHIAGQSTGVTADTDTPARLPSYWFDSRRRYFTKNHGTLYALGADLAFLAGRSAWEVRRRLQRSRSPDPPHLLYDLATQGTVAELWRGFLRRRSGR